MPRKVPELDTPFRTGEKVITTRDLPGVPEGSRGKVKLINGLHTWIRYWVKFDNGVMSGQISHSDLVRPEMLEAWKERAEKAALVEVGAGAGSSSPVPAEGATSADTGGAAGLIPPAILERSKAAKARLIG
jgi:hypothetical protein